MEMNQDQQTTFDDISLNKNSNEKLQEIESIIAYLDKKVFRETKKHLNDVQTKFLEGALQRKTYREIADLTGYQETYLQKVVGPRLLKILSGIFECHLNKENIASAIRGLCEISETFVPIIDSESSPYYDLVQSPKIANFYGRKTELNHLKKWIIEENCHLVNLVGIGGSGKTFLAKKLIEENQNQFQFINWKSLAYNPVLDKILADFLKQIAPDYPQTNNINQQIETLIYYLHKYRCLLILDRGELLIKEKDPFKKYKEGFENYGTFLKRIGESSHQSCLLITSQESLFEVNLLAKNLDAVKIKTVTGLSKHDGKELLKQKGLMADREKDFDVLINDYCGNPFLLNEVSDYIQELFDGNISEFVNLGTILIGNFSETLLKQSQRWSKLENEIISFFVNSQNGQKMSTKEIIDYLGSSYSISEILIALQSLKEQAFLKQENNNQHSFQLIRIAKEYFKQLRKNQV